MFSEEEFRAWFCSFAARMLAGGAELCGPYICPHRYREPCVCKKPNTFLYEQAAAECGIDLNRFFTIGDTASDVCADYRFGGQGCLVRTGWAVNCADVAPYAACKADSLNDAVTWILSHEDILRHGLHETPHRGVSTEGDHG